MADAPIQPKTKRQAASNRRLKTGENNSQELALVKERRSKPGVMTGNETEICERLKWYFETTGVKATYVAKLLEISIHTLRSYVYGRVPVRFSFACKFCSSFSVSIEWLATGKGDWMSADPLPPDVLCQAIPGNHLLSRVYQLVLADFYYGNKEPSSGGNPIRKSMLREHYIRVLASYFANELAEHWEKSSIQKMREDRERLQQIVPLPRMGYAFEQLFDHLSDFENWQGKGDIHEFIMQKLGLSPARYWRNLAIHPPY